MVDGNGRPRLSATSHASLLDYSAPAVFLPFCSPAMGFVATLVGVVVWQCRLLAGCVKVTHVTAREDSVQRD